MKTKNQFGGEDVKMKNGMARWSKQDGQRTVLRLTTNGCLIWSTVVDDSAPESVFASVWKTANSK